MKRFVFIFVLILTTAAFAFAEHPNKRSIGVAYVTDFVWDGFDSGQMLALTLTSPNMGGLHWGFSIDFLNANRFRLMISGDGYIIDQEIVGNNINIGWFLGAGAYVGYASYAYTDFIRLSAGARVPIGICIIPGNFMEVYASVVPSLGMGLNLGGETSKFTFPDGGLGFELGLRIWI